MTLRQLILAEERWHRRNKQSAPSPEFAKGFIAGLQQVRQHLMPAFKNVRARFCDNCGRPFDGNGAYCREDCRDEHTGVKKTTKRKAA